MELEGKKHKIRNTEYHSVNYQEILDFLREVPEIEIICARKGLASNGYFEPAYLGRDFEQRILPELRGGNYNPDIGCVIDVHRKRIPRKQRESKGIDDLIVFLKDKIGIEPFRMRNEKGEGPKHGWYPYPFLIYIEFGAEVKGEVKYVNLSPNENYSWKIKNLVKNGHVVIPTIIRAIK